MTGPITSFRDEYSFLSNFHIEPDGTHVEGEYQAAKTTDPKQARLLRFLSPSNAKREGQLVALRPDWEKVKVQVMTDLVMAKFRDHPSLAINLLLTCERELVEGNTWGDTFWGVCRGRGENYLGCILMWVRNELQEALVDKLMKEVEVFEHRLDRVHQMNKEEAPE